MAETLRAACDYLATVAPDWLQGLAPLAWYERYGKRIEDTHLPRATAAREASARPPDEAVQAARAWVGSEEGRQQYPRRAGVERTRSQAVRSYGLRHAWYWGAAKTHLQHVATWAARTIDRLVAWCNERPRAKSRTSRFAALAPVCAMS